MGLNLDCPAVGSFGVSSSPINSIPLCSSFSLSFQSSHNPRDWILQGEVFWCTMTVPMGDSTPSSWEIAERLFRKNIELKNRLRKPEQSKVPLDQDAWSEMRDTYEAVILQDHDFSEKHEVELTLWQLHHMKIKKFRARICGRTQVRASVATQDTKSVDQIKKFHSQFKSFLSEATVFYHDLILKIRAKYGLPHFCFSETPGNQAIVAKDAKKFGEMQKGLISCHRCLVYLGDLARYKVLYTKGDSAPDFSAASSYYVQAASIWPSGGNPHHQLAVLASYFEDHLVAVYRYFRSLAVDTPSLSARGHLFVAFEKNRESYSNYYGNADEQQVTRPEIFKAFSTIFVRLSDILFTKTSLETFGEVFYLAISNLSDLLSSGPEEELNFGQDVVENELYFVRLITILICTVHNVIKESDGQSYDEILRGAMVFENAFSFAFEFVGRILKRCVQLNDVASSYLLPAVLVFMEWLAFRPDIATRRVEKGKEATATTFFWEQCLSLMNKLIFSGLACVGGNDGTTFFSDKSLNDERDIDNRPALCEDFELRGFTPLKTAHFILDFSQKLSIGTDGRNNVKKTRLKRILISGKVLLQGVMIDQQAIYYDSNKKTFVIGTEPPVHDDRHTAFLNASEPNDVNVKPTCPDGKGGIAQLNEGIHEAVQPITSELFEGDNDDDDEIIVYRPPVAKNYLNQSAKSTVLESSHPVQKHSGGDVFSASQLQVTLSSISEPLFLERASRFNTKLNIADTAEWGLCDWHTVHQNSSTTVNCNPDITFFQSYIYESIIPMKWNNPLNCPVKRHIGPPPAFSKVPDKKNSVICPVKRHIGPPPGFSKVPDKKNHINCPVKRHIGPPPGFGKVPVKRLDDSVSKSNVNCQSTRRIEPIDYKLQPQVTNVNWLEFELPSELKLYAKQYSPQANPAQSLWSRDLFG